MALTVTLADPTIFDPTGSPYANAADPQQANRLRADVGIQFAGMWITAKTLPFLISMRLLTGAHIEDYQCEIELDDRDGTLPIPPIDSPLNVIIGWRGEDSPIVWEGVVHDIEHGFGRKQGGRRMWVHGFGAEQLKGGKEPQYNHWGEGAPDGQEKGQMIPVSTVLKAAAQEAGHSIEVHKDFDVTAMQQDYWQQAGESYYHFAKRLADQMGAVFRVKGGTIGQFTKQGQNIDGTPTPNVTAVWAKNLIGWRVRPLSARPMWAQTGGHYFDVSGGMWNKVKQAVQSQALNLASSEFQRSQPAPNQEQATAENSGDDDGMGQQQGPGRIVINGEPNAQGNCLVQLVGARPGVDGTYWCSTCEHIYSRQGYVTWCDVNAVQITGGSDIYKLQGAIPQPPPRPSNAPGGPTTPLPPPPLLGGG
jgi:hypothetical protein